MRPLTKILLILAVILTIACAGCTQVPPSVPGTPAPSPSVTPSTPATNQSEAAASMEKVLNTLVSVLQDRLYTADAEVFATGEVLAGTGITGQGADDALLSLAESNDWIVDAVTVSPDGRIAAVMPEQYQSVIGEFIGNQSHIITILSGKKPALSPIFLTVEGFEAATIAYPVISPGGDLMGGISVPFRPDLLIGPLVTNAIQGTGYGIDVIQATDGLILYDTDPAQIGKTPEDPVYANYPELKALMMRVMTEKSGTGVYRFPVPGSSQPVQKEAVWDTISLHGTEWRVVVERATG
jgi:hypothetical protein